jgi:hypothetical protein
VLNVHQEIIAAKLVWLMFKVLVMRGIIVREVTLLQDQQVNDARKVRCVQKEVKNL